jgi:hypothetical protein
MCLAALVLKFLPDTQCIVIAVGSFITSIQFEICFRESCLTLSFTPAVSQLTAPVDSFAGKLQCCRAFGAIDVNAGGEIECIDE